mmetsp:Transcript_17808/g.41791  ORF Transcript_17808/g.41791 Transcript_17808/m.41791 type:complete len:298 (-) Transcript_17808:140-1033(-)
MHVISVIVMMSHVELRQGAIGRGRVDSQKAVDHFRPLDQPPVQHRELGVIIWQEDTKVFSIRPGARVGKVPESSSARHEADERPLPIGLWSGCCPDGHSWGGRRVVRSPVDRQGRRLHPLSHARCMDGTEPAHERWVALDPLLHQADDVQGSLRVARQDDWTLAADFRQKLLKGSQDVLVGEVPGAAHGGLAVKRSVSSTCRSEGRDNGHLVPGVEGFALEGLLVIAIDGGAVPHPFHRAMQVEKVCCHLRGLAVAVLVRCFASLRSIGLQTADGLWQVFCNPPGPVARMCEPVRGK